MKKALQKWSLALSVGAFWPVAALADVPGPGGCSTATGQVDPIAAFVSIAVGVGIIYAMRGK